MAVSQIKSSIAVDGKTIDPNLAKLFASSIGPKEASKETQHKVPWAPELSLHQDLERDSQTNDRNRINVTKKKEHGITFENTHSPISSKTNQDEKSQHKLENLIEHSSQKFERKRKRKHVKDDLEGDYMKKLAREENREEEERLIERKLKRSKSKTSSNLEENSSKDTPENDDSSQQSYNETEKVELISPDVPVHESLAQSKEEVDLEKSSRTVFLANVSTLAISSKSAKKTLMAHLSSFLPDLIAPPDGKPPHKVESLRFRSTAFVASARPKKAAFVKKELMETTTKSTNAYVVYSTAFAARESVKRLNGTIVLERHLRVDGVAHPSKVDHRRCVFVGNLGFVDDESLLDQGGETERKRSKIPSDIEEGLWRQFSKAGTVESVRVIRDEKTRVGKGFAYVQFVDANSVEAALLFNDKKFPPMLPRILRVVRAKAPGKTASAVALSHASKNNPPTFKTRIFNPRISSEKSSLLGRAAKLLGRAGAAKLKRSEDVSSNVGTSLLKKNISTGNPSESNTKPPENFVFEGYRASSKSGRPKDLKLGGKKGSKAKTRSSNRSSAWKKGRINKSTKKS